jgi:hypothetical protein
VKILSGQLSFKIFTTFVQKVTRVNNLAPLTILHGFACNTGPNDVIWDSVSFLADCFALYFHSNDVMIIDDHENALHAHPRISNDKR